MKKHRNYILNGKTLKSIIQTFLLGMTVLSSCHPPSKQSQDTFTYSQANQSWQIKPFLKADSVNPILTPSGKLTFICPIRGEIIHWEEKDVFNPAAVFRDQKIYLLYRAEDVIGKYAGTSRLGLAVSEDGIHFTKFDEPVFYPDQDQMKPYEWEGGCEDPRVVEDERGKYYLTYTAWDGKTARLAIASSEDLFHWNKHGLIFEEFQGGKYRDLWSKSGAIICKRSGNQLIAAQINGKYWMYWGDTDIFLAHSTDLIRWSPLENPDGSLKSIFGPRQGFFDSDLVEPGPPALITDTGIILIYNSRNRAVNGDPDIPAGTYSAGQILFDPQDPSRVIDRSEANFFQPENDYEITGQVGNVCFLEGLVPLDEEWFLYYGTADSRIAVAIFRTLK